MTRTQLANSAVKNLSAEATYVIDGDGQILPGTQQSVIAGATIAILADPSSPSQYAGYVCAWRNGACRCASLVSDLDSGDAHMKIRPAPYHVAANAPEGAYTIYTPASGPLVGPIANENNGDLHVGH